MGSLDFAAELTVEAPGMHLAGGSFCLTEDMREADVPSVFKVCSSPQAVLLGICFLKTARRISHVKKAPSW